MHYSGNNVSLNEIGILGSTAKVSQPNFITTYPADQKQRTMTGRPTKYTAATRPKESFSLLANEAGGSVGNMQVACGFGGKSPTMLAGFVARGFPPQQIDGF
ncbi:hypothetical protein AB9E06_13755 [Rhizobium leguminosarum]|uniref:hypothetical protein n=1 Tax=Rhizobium leguminosarum TaxID=384 RepID=UPI0021B0967B|nr:hypothetical protein [Rhizobium leguminosarum]